MASHKKGERGRDYAAEYRARKAQGLGRGLAVPQARGHPRRGESAIAALRKVGLVGEPSGSAQERSLQAYYRVVKRLAKGEGLGKAARAEGTTPRTINRLNAERVLFDYHYRTGKRGQQVFDGYSVVNWARFHILAADGTVYRSVPLDRKNASLMGEYWNAVDEALKGKGAALKQFATTIVYDVDGATYRLLTNVNAIRRFFDSLGDEDAADFARNFYHGREVLYVAVPA
jgi:hypothetical protein